MEMKDAPLVQEEIASSKVSNLRKVAITVAVVALTVCGVAVGMVASGMENKTVPTLKYTPGTKATYNHAVALTQSSTKGSMKMDMAVEQYVLSTKNGATTFLITVPLAPTNNDDGAITVEVPAEGDSTAEIPTVSFVVTQLSTGAWDLATASCEIPASDELYESAAKNLLHHLDMTTPRLAKDATLSEVDATTGLAVDAKYAINNLEEGTSEVVRTVAPAAYHTQVNGAALANADTKTVTVKDGEVVSAARNNANEMSVMFTKEGPVGTGEVNRYIDNRETFSGKSTMVKGSTSNFDLNEFAKDLAAYHGTDLTDFVYDAEVEAPYVVGTNMEASAEQAGTEPELVEIAEEERSLLTLSVVWNRGKANEFGIAASLAYGGGATTKCRSGEYKPTEDRDAKSCANGRSLSITLTSHALLCGKKLSIITKWAKTSAKPGSTNKIDRKLTMSLGLSFKVSSSWTISFTFYSKTLWQNSKVYMDDKDMETPEVPLFKHPLITLGAKITFVAGFGIAPSLDGFRSMGQGKWACLRSCSGHCGSRRTYNRGGALKNDNQQWADLPDSWTEWYSSAKPKIFGVVPINSYRRYILLNGRFYTKSGCTQKYSTGHNRFRLKMDLTVYFEVTLDVYVQTGCIAGNRIRIGIEITGRFFSITIGGTAYILKGSNDCWMATYAQVTATITIKPYIQRRYGLRWRKSNCHKRQYIFKSLTGAFSVTISFPQQITAHLWAWSRPWLNYECQTSAPTDCGVKVGNAFNRPIYFNSACKNETYRLEPIYGGAKKFNTYR